MCALKVLPLAQLLRAAYPDLYPLHALRDHVPDAHDAHDAPDAHDHDDEVADAPDPPRLQLTAERYSLLITIS